MTHSTVGTIRPSRWHLAGLAIIAVSASLLFGALPGTASASTVNCKGKATLGITDNDAENAQTYQFTCSEAVVAYTIVTNRSTDYFTPDVSVYLGNPSGGNVISDAFQCEGPFPGNGFGCKGGASAPDATGPRFVVGGLATSVDPCAKHGKGAGYKVWVVVTTQENDGVNKPFYISSEPFRLGGFCKAAGNSARH